MSVGIGIGGAVAIGFCRSTQPIATAPPIPIPMIATQSEHDLHPDPHFLIKCPPVCELISIGRARESHPDSVLGSRFISAIHQVFPPR